MFTFRTFAVGLSAILLSGCVLVVGADRDEDKKNDKVVSAKVVRLDAAGTPLSVEKTECPEGTTTITANVSQQEGKAVKTLICTKTLVKSSSTPSVTDVELLQSLMLARTKLAADTSLNEPSRQRILEALDEQIARLTVTGKK